jgi:hypothetical protein
MEDGFFRMDQVMTGLNRSYLFGIAWLGGMGIIGF